MTKEDTLKHFKIVLAGDSGTGKTSLFSRFTRDEFNFKCGPTNVANNETYHFHLNNDTTTTTTIEMDIWDLGGREKYRAMANASFCDADGIFLVYDITNATSFENVSGWLKDIIQWAPPKTCIKLVGNKNDLQDQRSVSIEKAEELADHYGLSFIETSAMDTSTMTFECMIQDLCATMNSDSLFSTCAFISNRIKDDLSSNEIFHVVLVDLKKAASKEIHCVEKPFTDDLKYVAISYRWGEVQETVVDTHVGYTATITSFSLDDFYDLCSTITKEIDMKDMEYVWIDAICVNQTNYARRKATIHQMSHIYEHANYILAVPDLHKQYLENMSASFKDTMVFSKVYKKDLYYLLHGNTDKLGTIEEKWLNMFNVPHDPDLRQLLKSSTDHFTNGFMTHRLHHQGYNPETCLDYIYEMHAKNNNTTTTTPQSHEMECPLDLFDHQCQLPEWRQASIDQQGDYDHPWKQLVQERSHRIRCSMDLMKDLVKDWSTRVWVISEYSIAKKKNNMKYWFTQLEYLKEFKKFSFFKLDFDDISFLTSIQDAFQHDRQQYYHPDNNPVYLTFHKTMITQLSQQSFFEMMLKSKASKNVDRFYAIFPQTEYKNKIINKANVDQWNLNTLASVKLKLFEIMNIKDKLNLLFISGSRYTTHIGTILPTFATSSIDWEAPMDHFTNKGDSNFDLDDHSTIALCQHPPFFYLHLNPKQYFMKALNDENTIVSSHHQLESEPDTVVCIPSIKQQAMLDSSQIDWDDHVIYLVGNYVKNTWTLCQGLPFHYRRPFAPEFEEWQCRTGTSFNIY